MARLCENPAVQPFQSFLTCRHDLAEELEILPAYVRPKHRPGIVVSSALRLNPESGVTQET